MGASPSDEMIEGLDKENYFSYDMKDEIFFLEVAKNLAKGIESL